MLGGSPDRISATFKLTGGYFRREIGIEGSMVNFPHGNPVMLTAAEDSSLRDILTRLKDSNPSLEYPADGSDPQASAYFLRVTAPPTLAISIRACEPNSGIPGELRELSSLVSNLAQRLR